MKYSRIIKAINEGLDKALLSFDDEEQFDKLTHIRNKTAEYMTYLEKTKEIMENGIEYNFSIEDYQWFLEQYLTNGFLYVIEDGLSECIDICIDLVGPNCNLNWIDISNIDDLSYLFANSLFNGNISEWDVSNVTDMQGLFWDTNFKGDISLWDVSNVINMDELFASCPFNGDISKWDVSNVKYMNNMFSLSSFNGDISEWDVSLVINNDNIFKNCPIKEEYKPKFIC